MTYSLDDSSSTTDAAFAAMALDEARTLSVVQRSGNGKGNSGNGNGNGGSNSGSGNGNSNGNSGHGNGDDDSGHDDSGTGTTPPTPPTTPTAPATPAAPAKPGTPSTPAPITGGDGGNNPVHQALPGVTLTGSGTLLGTAGDDVLIGSLGSDVLVGGAGNDLLDAGGGDDVLDGGTGADTMMGGDGSDTYYVDDAGDLVVETATNALTTGTGTASAQGLPQHDVGRSVDKVIASINYTLTDFVENLALAGSAGDLRGTGNALNNVLTGNDGNNALMGGAGSDTLDGGAGLDSARYSGKLADYTLAASQSADALLVSDTRTGAPDGMDRLISIERLHFADQSLALDVGATQAAGKAMLLMAATLGVGFAADKAWAGTFLKFFDGGATVQAGSQLLVDSGVLAAFAHGTDNASLVSFIYNNVAGHAPDAPYLASTVAALDAHSTTLAQWMADMALSATNQAQVQLAGYVAHGLAYM